eukprot:1250738-Alexandrium_andersonii.AAC.1
MCIRDSAYGVLRRGRRLGLLGGLAERRWARQRSGQGGAPGEALLPHGLGCRAAQVPGGTCWVCLRA